MMSPVSESLPRAVDAALRKTTETLARELASPGVAAPDWSPFEWRVACAVAAMHGVSPLLSLSLPWQGPCGWRKFLEEQTAHTLSRHRRIEALLASVDRHAREANLPLIALKGAALHALGIYRAGERPMADIDLLVRPQDANRATGVLEALGFRGSVTTFKHRVFLPAIRQACGTLGEHAGNYLKIELHERLVEILPQRIWEMPEAAFPARPRPGLNAYASRAVLFTHLALHAAGAMAFRALRLLHLNDLARVAERLGPADWQEFLSGGAQGGKWWALPPLSLTERYYAATIPTAVLAELAASCPRRIRGIAEHRMLSDVSLSYPWIEAFPGICWAHSVAEVIGYAMSRLRPSREVLSLRERSVETEVAASHSDWTRFSQGRRILHWLVARPLRPDTLFAVRTALARE